jgi:hypothetical protein
MEEEVKIDTSLKIIKIPYLDTIVLKQMGKGFFITTKNSIVIDIAGLSLIIRFLVMNNMIDCGILERIIDEYRQNTD